MENSCTNTGVKTHIAVGFFQQINNQIQKTFMNTIRYCLFLLILLAGPLNGSGQTTHDPWQGISSRSNILQGKLSGKKYYMVFNTNGPHFYHYDFLPTTITLEDGEVCKNIMARYNAFINELVCYNTHTHVLFTIDKFIVKEFEVSSQITGIQRFVKIETGIPFLGTQFFHVLWEGEVTLLAYYQSKPEKTGIYRDRHGVLKDSELVLTETFYLYTEDTGLKKFPPILKSFLQLYKKDKKQVRRLLRKNRLFAFGIPELIQAFHLIEDAGIKP